MGVTAVIVPAVVILLISGRFMLLACMRTVLMLMFSFSWLSGMIVIILGMVWFLGNGN
jgi:hypothetical protein